MPALTPANRGDPLTDWREPAAVVHALLFTAFVLAMPWDTLAIGVYLDFEVYAEILHPAAETIRELYGPFGPLDLFTREVAWNDLMTALIALAGSPETALRWVSAFVLTVHAWVLFRRFSALSCWLLLLNPLFLVFGLSQLRLAFATALLLLALESGRWLPRVVLVGFALFVHTSVPMFLVMFAVVRWVERQGDRIGWFRLLAVAGGTVMVFALALSSARDIVLSALGDRRAFTYDTVNPESLRVVVFWIGFLAVQLAAGLAYLRRPDNLYAFMLVALFVALTLLSTYGSRFVAAGYVVVMASMLNLRHDWRQVVVPVYLAYQLLQAWYWFGLHLGR
jgi:hypothetical protein